LAAGADFSDWAVDGSSGSAAGAGFSGSASTAAAGSEATSICSSGSAAGAALFPSAAPFLPAVFLTGAFFVAGFFFASGTAATGLVSGLSYGYSNKFFFAEVQVWPDHLQSYLEGSEKQTDKL
jgi:hypothetical protein